MYTDVLFRWSKYQKGVNFIVKMYPSSLKNNWSVNTRDASLQVFLLVQILCIFFYFQLIFGCFGSNLHAFSHQFQVLSGTGLASV